MGSKWFSEGSFLADLADLRFNWTFLTESLMLSVSMLARHVQEVHILCKIEGREDKNDPREGLDCLKH